MADRKYCANVNAIIAILDGITMIALVQLKRYARTSPIHADTEPIPSFIYAISPPFLGIKVPISA